MGIQAYPWARAVTSGDARDPREFEPPCFRIGGLDTIASSYHRQAKQDSERAVAVCALAKQAMLLLKTPPPEMKFSNN